MKKYFAFLFVSWFIGSCGNAVDPGIKNYVHAIIQSDSMQMKVVDRTLVTEMAYNENIAMPTENIASIVALTLLDTAHVLIDKERIENFTIQIRMGKTRDTISYSLESLRKYEKGIEATSMFLQNMLIGEAIRSIRIVDTTLIPLARVDEINAIGQELKTKMSIDHMTFDGFNIVPAEPHVMQCTVKLMNAQEQIIATFQYDTRKEKIFYFGINDSE